MKKTAMVVTALLGLSCRSMLADRGNQELAPGLKRAKFAVTWYDVGKQALDGLPGVQSVSTGWSGFHEANEVVYDPNTVDVPKLEQQLRRAGTYIKTLDPE